MQHRTSNPRAALVLAVAPLLMISAAAQTLVTCAASGIPIPDNSPMGVTSVINVPGAGFAIPDIEVRVKIRHTWVGDLRIELVHSGSGITVTLLDRPGFPASAFGCGEDDIDCVFSDSATGDTETLCGVLPYTAIGTSAMSFTPLGALVSQNVAGDWTLRVSDNAGGDTGVLDYWCLFINAGAAIITGLAIPDPGQVQDSILLAHRLAEILGTRFVHGTGQGSTRKGSVIGSTDARASRRRIAPGPPVRPVGPRPLDRGRAGGAGPGPGR